MTRDEKIDLMVEYGKYFIKTFYKWGGDDPSGMDCSGFLQECLACIGADPPGDQSAESLFYELQKKGWQRSTDNQRGSILFFGKERITHVALAIDELHMIEAGGGNSLTLNEADAIKQNAFIRIRPIKNRNDLREKLISPINL